MTYHIDDLGPQASGDTWLSWRLMRHPNTREEYAVGSLSSMGLMVVHPQTREAQQVSWDNGPLHCAWAIDQGPDGAIYQADYEGRLVRWDWADSHSREVTRLPLSPVFGMGVSADGMVYATDYTKNVVVRYDPRDGSKYNYGTFADFGDHVRDVYTAPDGMVYVTCTTYNKGTVIVAIDPRTDERYLVPREAPERVSTIIKDVLGRVLIAEKRWGREVWQQLMGGEAVAIDPADVRLTSTDVGEGPWAVSPRVTPLAFADGSYLTKIYRDQFTYIDAQGQAVEFAVTREETPLDIWCIGAGADRVWGGNVFPPMLFEHDPASGTVVNYGNVTPVTGEIYNIAVSHGKVYMASYPQAVLTRFTPDQPWVTAATPQANPAQLGKMKEDGLPLHRPHGKTVAPDGTVFFSSVGSYGCEDSGICRIDPDTDTVMRWVYPNTDMDAICFLPGLDQLVVSDSRRGENALRFTFIDPQTGAILFDEVAIPDLGVIRSWCYDGADTLYGIHAYRATLFAYSLSQRKIIANLPELPYGEHCYNCLLIGPNDRLWGLTAQCVFAASRDLSAHEIVAEYTNFGQGGYRFGMEYGPDGHIYFPNGPNLMRVTMAE